MKNPLELVDFFIAFACINYSYMVQQIREKIEIEGEGLLAQAIAHEIDHLEGILYIDKVIPGTLEYSTPQEQKQGEM